MAIMACINKVAIMAFQLAVKINAITHYVFYGNQ